IYRFGRRALDALLEAHPTAVDLVREVIPGSLAALHYHAHLFDGYWEDLGTVKAYHEANLALAGDQPPFDFHSPEGVIYTRMRNLPASRVTDTILEHCLVSDGCVVLPGTRLLSCVVGVRSRIGRNVTLRDTVMIGADRFEADAERTQNRQDGRPDIGVGDGSVIERAIIDKDCRIGREVHLVNRRNLQDADGSNYVIREGIIVIPKGAVVPDGTVI